MTPLVAKQMTYTELYRGLAQAVRGGGFAMIRKPWVAFEQWTTAFVNILPLQKKRRGG